MDMRTIHLAMDGGGAFVAARRLHDGLRRIDVNSRMIVSAAVSHAVDVEAVEFASGSLIGRVRRRTDARRFARERRVYAKTESPKMIYFSDDRVAGQYILNQRLPETDVCNLHWVAGVVDYRRFFGRLKKRTPLVWTLHDMNPFTGGCHYALDCLRFTSKCGSCPQLGSESKDDLSARIYARKSKAFSKLSPETTRIVTPSKWLGAEASRSSLFGRFTIDVIPYGLDVDVFTPRRRETAREVFAIPRDDLVVVFAAHSIGYRHKGFDLLRESLAQLTLDRPVTLAAIGHKPLCFDGGARCMMLGHINSERMMSFALSAADLFVFPTRTDNFPNVVLEAMACGVPVVSFNVGGVADMVRPGQTGLLAPPEDVAALRNAIESILRDNDLRAKMSAECRKIAVQEYSLEVQARRYKALYATLTEASRVHIERRVVPVSSVLRLPGTT
jgi:glycosyltransferase involved in cell wall biosynthesis